MTHFASINVRSRRVLPRKAVLWSFYSQTPQKPPPLASPCTALHHHAISLPPLSSPRFPQKQRRSQHIPIEIP
jgi:hypothetical protein